MKRRLPVGAPVTLGGFGSGLAHVTGTIGGYGRVTREGRTIAVALVLLDPPFAGPLPCGAHVTVLAASLDNVAPLLPGGAAREVSA